VIVGGGGVVIGLSGESFERVFGECCAAIFDLGDGRARGDVKGGS